MGSYDIVTTPSNEHLLLGGEPNPRFIASNRIQYGYTCPRLEFVESVQVPTLRELAIKWHVSAPTIAKWVKNGQWMAQRDRAWKQIEERQWELTAEVLAHARAKEVSEQLNDWRKQRDILRSVQMRGVVDDQSATGEKFERPLGPGEMKLIIQSLAIVNKELRELYGMGQALLRQAGIVEEDTVDPISHMIINLNVQNNVEVERAPQALIQERVKRLLDDCAEAEVINAIEETDGIPELPQPTSTALEI